MKLTMPFPALNLTAALLATTAYANALLPPTDGLVLRAHDVLHRPYASLLSARAASAALPGADSHPEPDYLEDGIPMLARRQAVPEANSTGAGLNETEPGITLNPDRSLNFTAWSAAVNPACAQSLNALRQSTNPSGACVCYNIISLDIPTGMFEADLRLFEVSPPRGDFAGVSTESIRVFLDYNGATASGTNLTAIEGVREGAPTGGARLNQVYRIKGQIDQDKMDDNMTVSALEIVLMPKVTLRATNPQSQSVDTPVSSNEASFLAGVFSSQSVMSDFSAAQLAVDEALLSLRNGTTAFVLPGTQLMIFPIGLVISGAWFLIGLGVYGFGTFERMQYADMYKTRMARKGASNTI